MTDEKNVQTFQETHLRERLAEITASLRRMADNIDRDVKTARTLDSAVSGTIHTLSWGYANLNLSILVDNLSRYHEVGKLESGEAS